MLYSHPNTYNIPAEDCKHNETDEEGSGEGRGGKAVITRCSIRAEITALG